MEKEQRFKRTLSFSLRKCCLFPFPAVWPSHCQYSSHTYTNYLVIKLVCMHIYVVHSISFQTCKERLIIVTNGKMGGKWLYSLCFVGSCFPDFCKTTRNILAELLSRFFSMFFVIILVVNFYRNTNTVTCKKKFRFILSQRSDFLMIDNLSIAVHAFTRRMLTSFSLDEMFTAELCEVLYEFQRLTEMTWLFLV